MQNFAEKSERVRLRPTTTTDDDYLNQVTKEFGFGMKINVKKTKMMCISQYGNNNKLTIYVDGQQVEQ